MAIDRDNHHEVTTSKTAHRKQVAKKLEANDACTGMIKLQDKSDKYLEHKLECECVMSMLEICETRVRENDTHPKNEINK